ncbi:hypothetical protein [Pantoea cypripedii]|uniref:Uncharacterized protein n=1 Tax=Pantoea cypripedii TaxID=55209 RepID=A0A6B9GEI1_PANCY|nr:hypothetical protein [Pantoea cypripedii]QGY31356.1 hypothetical protein CUN67_17015 [Pantoea cypripedii]
MRSRADDNLKSHIEMVILAALEIAPSKRKRRVYNLTSEGQQELIKKREAWDSYSIAVSSLLQRGVNRPAD